MLGPTGRMVCKTLIVVNGSKFEEMGSSIEARFDPIQRAMLVEGSGELCRWEERRLKPVSNEEAI